jgi:hypothetical protein
MQRLSLYAGLLALFAGSAVMLQHNTMTGMPTMSDKAGLNSNAAYRDGLYLGGLAAKGGSPGRVAIGRWAAESDRALFRAGFRRGYDESVAGHPLAEAAARQND